MSKIETTENTEADDLFDAVESQALLCRKLAARVESAKEVLKDCKTEYDEATDELTRLALVRQEVRPLFDDAEEE